MEEINNEENKGLEEESALLKAYKNLEANSVPKEKYEKEMAALKEKNDLYLKAITEGEKINSSPANEISLEDKIKELSTFKGTNLEYWEKVTSAIDDVLKKTPEAEVTKVTGVEGLEELIKVNEGMKQMVADADGDPDYFRTLYKQRVQDSAPRISAEIEKAGNVYNYLSKSKK